MTLACLRAYAVMLMLPGLVAYQIPSDRLDSANVTGTWALGRSHAAIRFVRPRVAPGHQHPAVLPLLESWGKALLKQSPPWFLQRCSLGPLETYRFQDHAKCGGQLVVTFPSAPLVITARYRLHALTLCTFTFATASSIVVAQPAGLVKHM